MPIRTSLGLAPLLAALGCAQVSGLGDFELDANGVGGGGGGTSSTGGSGGTGTGASAGGGGSGGQPIASGPFQGIQLVGSLASPDDDDDDPTFTADGLELYFNTSRGGGSRTWRAIRSSVDEAWGPPSAATELSVGSGDSNGVVSPDGSTFWLVAEVPENTIYVSRRTANVWSQPTLDAQQFDPLFGFVGAVNANMTLMIYSSGSALHQATRVDENADWSMPTPIAGLGNGNQQGPWLSPDGLHLYWVEAGSLFRANRPEVRASFSTPITIPEINAVGWISDPWLTADQSYIMFTVGEGTDRAIYEARRPIP